ncbi:MAG: hypothetical protein ACK4ML_00740 [Alishewanella aestuarii]
MSKPTRRSVIPNIPTNVDPNMRQFLEAVRESMQVTMGQRGNKLDSAVTFRDLEGKFGVTMQAINALREEVGRPKPEGGVIDAPTGLGVAYAFDTALVYWDFPYMSGYAYTEVFRVGVEALNGAMPSEPAFSEDYLIATVDGSRITDTIAPDFAYFYWVRHVGRNGKNSAISGPVFALGSDLPSKIVDDVLGQLPNDPFIQELQQRIADIDLTPLEQADQLLQSELASLVQALANADQRLTAADQALQAQIDGANAALQSADQRLTAADQALQSQIDDANTALQSTDQRLTAADQALDEAINDAKEFLEGQIASQGSSITALQSTTATQATSLNNLITRVGSAESSITSLNTTTGNHASRLTSIESVNTTQGTNISSLQATTASHATSISRLGAFDTTANKYAFIKNLEEVDATQASQISGLTTRMEGAESSITTLNNTTATQATSLNNLITRVGSAESSITSLNTTTGNHASRLTSIESVNTTQGTNISSLQTTTNSHATSISRLGAFDTTANKYAFIKNLEEVDATQASQISGLTTRMTGAESSITTLNNTTATQATNLNNLTTRVGSAESSISTLNTTTAGHTTSINSLNTRMGSAESSITSLNNTTSSQATSLSNLTTRMGTAESGISSLNTTTSSQATSINNLTTRIGTAESGITALNTTTASQALEIRKTRFSVGDSATVNHIASLSTGHTGEVQNPVNNANVTMNNGRIRLVGTQWLFHSQVFRIDPNRRYKVRFVVQQIQDPTSGGNLVYAGVGTLDGNFNALTANPETHRYCAIAGHSLTVAQGRRVFEGVITGEGNVTHNQFRPGTVFVRPMFIVNHSGGNGITEVESIEIRDITEEAAVEDRSRAYIDNETGVLKAQRVLKVDANGVVASMGLDATSGGESRLSFVADQMNFVTTTGGTAAGALAIRNGRLVFRSAIAENIDVENLRAANAVAVNFAAAGSVQLPAGVIKMDNLDNELKRRLVLTDPDAAQTGGSASIIRTLKFMGSNADRGYGTFISTTILGGNNNTEVNLKFNGSESVSGRNPIAEVPWYTAPKLQFRIRRGTTLLTIPAEQITLINNAAGTHGATIAHLGSNLYEVTGKVFSYNEPDTGGQTLWERATFVTFDMTFNIGRFTNESAYSIEIVQTSGGIGTLEVIGSFNIFEPAGSTGGLVVNTSWDAIAGKPATATRWPSWTEVTSKPTTFTPSAHTHAWSDITSGVPATATRWPTWSEVTSKPSTFTPSAHTHDFRDLFAHGDSPSYQGRLMLASLFESGNKLRPDEEFEFGNNGVSVYNNSGGTAVTITRLTGQTAVPNRTGNILRVSSTTGTTSPGRGGFFFSDMTRPGAVYVAKIRARIPVGFSIQFASNATGTDSLHRWITSQEGTGKWEDYVHIVYCGNSGSFSSTNFFWLNGSGEVTWDIASATVIDITDRTNRSFNRIGVSNGVVGNLEGNANTATTLQTARTINGTSFNGSANITTANWGTGRTLTIGNTGKSVDGSGNVSWSLAEIGAFPASGGTLTGMLVAPTIVTTGGEGNYNATNFGSTNLGAINIRSTTSGNTNAITFSSAAGANAQAGIYVNNNNLSGTTMHLATTSSYATGPQARMTILPNGNIGIGTSNPSQPLHVIGTAEISTDLRLSRSDASGPWVGSTANVPLRLGTNGVERARINADGTWSIQNSMTLSAGNISTSSGHVTTARGVRSASLGSSWINGHRDTDITNLGGIVFTTTGSASSYHRWMSMRTPSGGWSQGVLGDSLFFTWAIAANIDSATNTVNSQILRLNADGVVQIGNLRDFSNVRYMKWSDFSPTMGPPAGLENVITANWLAAGVVQANILASGGLNVEDGGNKVTIHPKSSTPILFEKDGETTFSVNIDGTGFFKGSLAKDTVSAEAIQEEAKKAINPKFLGGGERRQIGSITYLTTTTSTSSSSTLQPNFNTLVANDRVFVQARFQMSQFWVEGEGPKPAWQSASYSVQFQRSVNNGANWVNIGTAQTMNVTVSDIPGRTFSGEPYYPAEMSYSYDQSFSLTDILPSTSNQVSYRVQITRTSPTGTTAIGSGPASGLRLVSFSGERSAFNHNTIETRNTVDRVWTDRESGFTIYTGQRTFTGGQEFNLQFSPTVFAEVYGITLAMDVGTAGGEQWNPQYRNFTTSGVVIRNRHNSTVVISYTVMGRVAV